MNYLFMINIQGLYLFYIFRYSIFTATKYDVKNFIKLFWLNYITINQNIKGTLLSPSSYYLMDKLMT
jgi:hypothetical protein